MYIYNIVNKSHFFKIQHFFSMVKRSYAFLYSLDVYKCTVLMMTTDDWGTLYGNAKALASIFAYMETCLCKRKNFDYGWKWTDHNDLYSLSHLLSYEDNITEMQEIYTLRKCNYTAFIDEKENKHGVKSEIDICKQINFKVPVYQIEDLSSLFTCIIHNNISHLS